MSHAQRAILVFVYLVPVAAMGVALVMTNLGNERHVDHIFRPGADPDEEEERIHREMDAWHVAHEAGFQLALPVFGLIFGAGAICGVALVLQRVRSRQPWRTELMTLAVMEYATVGFVTYIFWGFRDG